MPYIGGHFVTQEMFTDMTKRAAERQLQSYQKSLEIRKAGLLKSANVRPLSRVVDSSHYPQGRQEMNSRTEWVKAKALRLDGAFQNYEPKSTDLSHINRAFAKMAREEA